MISSTSRDYEKVLCPVNRCNSNTSKPTTKGCSVSNVTQKPASLQQRDPLLGLLLKNQQAYSKGMPCSTYHSCCDLLCYMSQRSEVMFQHDHTFGNSRDVISPNLFSCLKSRAKVNPPRLYEFSNKDQIRDKGFSGWTWR